MTDHTGVAEAQPNGLPAAMSDSVAATVRALTAGQWDGSGAALLRAVGRTGLLASCLAVDRRRPLRLDRFRELIEALAIHAPSGPTLSCVVHLATFLPIVRRLAHESLRDVADGATDGRIVGTIAATDAGGAGSDLAGMATSIELSADRLVVRGTKEWITSATFADYYAVVARHRPGRHFSSLCLVLVPADAPGVTRQAVQTTVMAGAGIGRVQFDDVVLKPTALLGRPGRGFAYFVEQMSAERLAGGIWAAATTHQVLARTVRHLRTHEVQGEPLWARSAVRHDLARLAVSVRMLEALVNDIVRAAGRDGRLSPTDTTTLKAALGPIVVRTVDRCLQLHGADGFTVGRGLLELLDDVRTFGVAGGTTETMLDVVASGLVDRAAVEASAR